MKLKESELAHKYCIGSGLEIGGSAHNAFGLNTKNVDFTDELTIFKQAEIDYCGEYMKVDIIANGNSIPVDDESQDFVISSHVIEHFYDPIDAINEWLRVVKPGGIIFIICPHKDRTFDKDNPVTPLNEIIDRHTNKTAIVEDDHRHWCIWRTEDFMELCSYMNLNVIECLDVDDKVGNGFCVVIRK